MKRRFQSGFSFIEVMIGVVIISVAAYGMVLSATHARGVLRTITIKERAVDELIGFVEHMKGRIADGNMTLSEKSGDFMGETVYLFGNEQNDVKIPAKIFYENITPVFTDSISYIDRYLLHAWIEWEDFSTPRTKVVKRADIEMVMLEFPQ